MLFILCIFSMVYVCIYLVVVYRTWCTLVRPCFHIYIYLVFPLVVVHSLPLSPLLSVPSKYLHFSGENYTFLCRSGKLLHAIFSYPFKYPSSPFLVNIRSFQFVSSMLFINLYIVIKSPLSILFSNVVSDISFNLSLYIRSPKSGTILVVILCILSNFVPCFLLWGDHITSAHSNFGLIIRVIIFLVLSFLNSLGPREFRKDKMRNIRNNRRYPRFLGIFYYFLCSLQHSVKFDFQTFIHCTIFSTDSLHPLTSFTPLISILVLSPSAWLFFLFLNGFVNIHTVFTESFESSG